MKKKRARVRLGDWTCPSGNNVVAYIEPGAGRLDCQWDSPPPLSPDDQAHYDTVVGPAIMECARQHLGLAGPALTVNLYERPRTYRVHYPSGRVFSLHGVLASLVLSDGGRSPAVVQLDGPRVAVLDPRAVLVRDDGAVTHPRQAIIALPGWAVEWLDEHPEWPGVVTEDPR
jgi:hypothetical protein